jgi:glycosyltransferase involved in cell wall biosynthesis
MNIGYDAKRAFLNKSGLGNYSRTIILSMLKYFPDCHQTLFTPKTKDDAFENFIRLQAQVKIIEPNGLLSKPLGSIWRSIYLGKEIKNEKCEVFHGLSNELPLNVLKYSGKKIVTIHDLIFLRYPHLYGRFDRTVYFQKFKFACKNADHIIAISEETKKDILQFFSIDENKISVIYQSCHDRFRKTLTETELESCTQKLGLPQKYVLSVGTIEPRKNLLSIVKAMNSVNDVPLVVVGKRTQYFKKVFQFIVDNKLSDRIIFLDNIADEDLPALYQLATVFVYPSLIEGFGIPIIEALTSGVPVITNAEGCFSEAGGPKTIYVDPLNVDHLAEKINCLLDDVSLRNELIVTGKQYVNRFHPELVSQQLMELYKQ